MTKIEVNGGVVVDGVKYVPASSKDLEGDLKIVILQRGWVMVGRLVRDGDNCLLHEASVIRRWGTKKGLGELAHNGPLKETILDKCHGVVEFNYLTVIATIAVDGTKWLASSYL